MRDQQYSVIAEDMSEYGLAEDLLEAVCSHSPTVRRAIGEHGEDSLATYLHRVKAAPTEPFQPRQELIEAIYRHAAPLLGASVAERASQDLARHPVVLTANHHGVDFLAQSVQGTLLLALNQARSRPAATTVTVIACGNVPLNNLTIPLGMLLYEGGGEHMAAVPRRLPLISNRYKRCVVSAAKSFDRAMIDRALKRAKDMAGACELSASLAKSVQEILRSEYMAASVLDLPDYSSQATVLNHRLWKRLFSNAPSMPDIVYLELEKVVATLLEADLKNPQSLIHLVMFDGGIKDRVLQQLEGHRICWDRNHLADRLDACRSPDQQRDASANGCGSVFFWGVDDKARKVPLLLKPSKCGTDVLCGVDDSGKLWEFPFTPDALIRAMQAGRLLPSLFTCYLAVSLARHVVCLGGYYQAEYLPSIQRALLDALTNEAADSTLVEALERVPTDGYLSGMQTVMIEAEDGHLIPAGPLEIIAAGGLTAQDLETIRGLTVREAHMASLFETIPDIAPLVAMDQAWKRRLAADCFHSLGARVVVK